MINIEITNQPITTPGLYIMRWKGKTGMVRIVGEPRRGFTIIAPQDSPESYLRDMPPKGEIPEDALFS